MDFASMYTPEVIEAAERAGKALRERIVAEREMEKRAKLERWPLAWVKSVGPVPVPPGTERSRQA